MEKLPRNIIELKYEVNKYKYHLWFLKLEGKKIT